MLLSITHYPPHLASYSLLTTYLVSVAVQFDVHSNHRWVHHTVCREYDPYTGACATGALKVTQALESDREYALSVYVGGRNAHDTALATYLLEPHESSRFDDGNPHTVRLEYLPPGASGAGRLNIYLDNNAQVALSLPLTLNQTYPGSVRGEGTAYVGFTASTGSTSELHDIRSFSYCHLLGCTAA